MPNSWLLDTNYNGGLQETHYFDGRLLTADALKADQGAIQTRQNWLGKVAGYGVIEGLAVGKVSTGVAGLSITTGLGINYTGHILYLPGTMNLTIGKGTPQSSPKQTMKKPSTFTSAYGQQQTATSGKGAGPLPSTGNLPEGVYLLTILPARTKFEGLAPMRSGVSGVSTGISNVLGGGCKWEVKGVQFKAIRLDTSDLSGLFKDVKDIKIDDKGNLRQNLLAHWCYGTLSVRDFGIHPFGFPDIYSPLNPKASESSEKTLKIPDLSNHDLPLAVFHWDGSKITFVDQWAARRRVIHPSAVTGRWTAVMDDRHVADNQARFHQFQDQLDGIVASGNKLTGVQATEYFTFLPPLGFLPVTRESLQTLLCTPYDEIHGKHEGSKVQTVQKEQREAKSGSDFQLALSEPELRALGEFAGGAAGTLLSMTFPAGALVGTAGGGMLARIAGGIGSLLHLDTPPPTVPGENLGLIVQDLVQRVQFLEGRGQQYNDQPAGAAGPLQLSRIIGKVVGRQQPGSQPASAGVQQSLQAPSQQLGVHESLHGESEEKRTEQVSPHVQFRERLCATIKQTRTGPDVGFDPAKFFDGYLLRISLIGKDRVDLLMNESWYEDAIDLRPDQYSNPSVQPTSQATHSIEEGLHRIPLLFDIYLVEENLLDTSQPLYVIFHKSLHPVELIRYYKHRQQTPKDPPQAPTPGPIM